MPYDQGGNWGPGLSYDQGGNAYADQPPDTWSREEPRVRIARVTFPNGTEVLTAVESMTSGELERRYGPNARFEDVTP